MKKIFILLLFPLALSSQNKRIRIEIPTGSGGSGTDTIQFFTHTTGGGDLLSTLSRLNAGSIKITPGTEIKITPTINGVNGIAKISTDFNGCANCVGYFGPNAGYVNDSIQTDAPFYYQYEEGFGTLNTPQLNLNSTNSYNNPVALFVEQSTPTFGRVFVSATESSGFSSTTFFHKVTTASSLSLPSGLTGSAAHFILNDGFAFSLNRAASETINGGTSVSYTASDKMIVAVNDGAGKWFSFVPGSGGGGGSPSLSFTGTTTASLNISGGGSGVTLTQGPNTIFTTTAGNLTIAAAATNLTTSGSSSAINVNSATGSGFTINAGPNVNFSAIGGSSFTINASLSSAITGSGTTNFHAKFSSASVLTNSLIQDNGTGIGMNGSSPFGGILTQWPTGDIRIGTTSVPSPSNRLQFGDNGCSTCPYIGEEGVDDRMVINAGTLALRIGSSVGSNGQVLTSNGTTQSWQTPAGGSGTPAGGLNAVQYNNPIGTFAGTSAFTFDASTNTLQVGNSSTSNLRIGTGTLPTATNRLYFGSTGMFIGEEISTGRMTLQTTSLVMTLNGSGGSTGQVLTNSGGFVTWATPAGITGSLTSGFVPRATGTTTVANGSIQDNGSVIGIGTAPNASFLTTWADGNLRLGAAGALGSKMFFGTSGQVTVGEIGASGRVFLTGTSMVLQINGATGSNGQVLTSNGTTNVWATPAAGGTVTGISTSGGLVTTPIGGTGSITWANGSGISITNSGTSSAANLIFAAPLLGGTNSGSHQPIYYESGTGQFTTNVNTQTTGSTTTINSTASIVIGTVAGITLTLPSPVAGKFLYIINTGGNYVHVAPPAGVTLTGFGTASWNPIDVSVNNAVGFLAVSATVWQTVF